MPFVKGFDPVDGYRADIAANATLAEQQGHPGVKAGEQFGPNAGVGVEVVVGAVGKGVEQAFHPDGAFPVNGHRLRRIQKEPRPQVVIQGRFPLDFG